MAYEDIYSDSFITKGANKIKKAGDAVINKLPQPTGDLRQLGAGLRSAVDFAKAAPGAIVNNVVKPVQSGFNTAMDSIAEGYTGQPSLAQAKAPGQSVVPPTQAAPSAVPPVGTQNLNAATATALDPTAKAPVTPGQAALSVANNQRANRPDQGVSVIRGTQQETVRPGLATAGNGGDPEFIAWSGTGPDTPENRAASYADSLRRNNGVLHTDSDQIRAVKIAAANKAADDYYEKTTGNAVDREKTAATKQVGLANVDARYHEANLSAQTSRQNAGLHGSAPEAVDWSNEKDKLEVQTMQRKAAQKDVIAAQFAEYYKANGKWPEDYYNKLTELGLDGE